MTKQVSNIQTKIQQFGGILSSMVMPNIGAFIAWGIVTMLFIPTGWVPNEYFGALVGPSIVYMLPLLIAYTGGYNVYDKRGGVIGAIVAMGVIVGTEIPMIMAAMVVGPISAWLMKKLDKFLDGKIPQGLEMLINNFSIGILGAILMLLARWGIQPIFTGIIGILSLGVNWIVDHNLLPFSAIFVAPAQVLFLNNAINHGILVPLGVAQVQELGRSILFLVEANNAPPTGVMLAIMIFGRGIAKRTAPATTIIQFFGGIVEVYFPYILMKPVLIIATIAGSMTSLFLFQMLGGGLVGVPSPGSVFAFLAMITQGYYVANLIGYVAGGVVSFFITMVILKANNFPEESEENLAMEGVEVNTKLASDRSVKKIYVACDAGMGSSAMGASILKSKVKKAMLDIEVANIAVDKIPVDADMVITHLNLVDRAKEHINNNSVTVIGMPDFMNSTTYDGIVDSLKQNNK